ncbi:MAG TPA: TIGR02757 family protein, partial [Bacteroidales bacterium]|nr:TIGR02757 family protein [Bacteroidales bacterium]
IDLLNEKYLQYNAPFFIESDPVSIPHLYAGKEDIEISAFLTATISWGNRQSILKDALKLMQMMDHSPAEFVMNATEKEITSLKSFYHRTFNGADCIFFIRSLRNIYLNHGGLEQVFSKDPDLKTGISGFKQIFLETEHLARSEKHIADPLKGSSAKRILMFLRWMVRNDSHGVDFGIWKNIRPAQLYIPIDIHAGNIARNLGLLSRRTNDWKAVEELTAILRRIDPDDPVKYDFALFGMGVFEKINVK